MDIKLVNILQIQVAICLQMFLIILALLVLKIGLFKLITYHGYTIEAGIGENPLPLSQFDTIYADNLGILVLGAVF